MIKFEKFSVLLTLVGALIVSCEDNIIITDVNDCNEVEYFYDNNELHSKGIICDSVKNGLWEEYYKDGYLKWKGEYRHGERFIDSNEINRKFDIDILDLKTDVLSKEHSYTFRITNKGNIHPDDLVIMATNSQITYNTDRSAYDFTLKPEKTGLLKLFICIDIEESRVFLDTLVMNIGK